ncbi:MAG: DNA polymerase III subunit delta' [Paludibacteraceae bacterium]|nr:DNA polymerase III subunit delta' [Paludibacteraceae bacterium]
MKFAQIIGHDSLKQRLISTVQEQRIAHAQLFCGQEGVGKLQLALAYAQYVNCQHPTPTDSCGQCPSCLQYQRLQHPDLHFVFPIIKSDSGHRTSVCDDYLTPFRNMILERGYFSEGDWYAATWSEVKMGQIYASESSEILRKLSLKSFEGGYKVMIIWLPERMNETCANKILKILEEPSAKTLFLLVSNSPDQLLTTIVSRTQRVQVDALQEGEIAGALVRRFDDVDRQAVTDAARLARGSYLRALQLIEQEDDSRVYFEWYTQLMRQAWLVRNRRDYQALQGLRSWSLQIADKSISRNRQVQFLQYCQRLTRENFVRNLHIDALNCMTEQESRFAERFSPFVNESNIEGITAELAKAERQIEKNGNAKMIFFNLALQMIMQIR